MTITVILCTYNRCQNLRKALDSLALSAMPAAISWEVLVVDNNSSDHTREVVEEFRLNHPLRFRYLFEPQPGKSHALNAGIRQASGDVLAFVDDDIIVDKNWLHELTMNLEGHTCAGAGGRILPANNFSPPAWLPLDGSNNMGGILALFDLGEKPIDLGEPPFGTNMAFQKRMFEKYGGFRTDLGPRPESELRNEDTEFGRRLLKAGERLRYVPSAVVYHRVPEDRLTKKYFLEFCFDHGRASIREIGKRPEIWGIPRNYLTLVKISMLLATRAARWLATCLNPRLGFYNRAMVWMTAGEVLEVWCRICPDKVVSSRDAERRVSPPA